MALYVVEAPLDAEVVLDDEHDRFLWLPLADALRKCLPSVVASGLANTAALDGTPICGHLATSGVGSRTLSHNGVLFLDELTEFRRDALEGFRQPLEHGRVVVTRVIGSVEVPARFTLVPASGTGGYE